MNPPPRPRRGWPEPLGASLAEGGVNFAVWSRHATAMTLALFQPGGEPWAELPLPPATHRSGDVWHAFVPGAGPGIEYGWRAASTHRGPQHAFDPARLLLDPWGRAVAGAEVWGRREPEGRRLRSVVVDDAFAWGGDQPLRRPAADSVIYELHVRAFTRHPSAGVAHPGTYAGLSEKLPHLAALGVTAVQLMPVAEFDETGNPRTHPRTGAPLLNVWGYAPLAFGAPKLAYAADATPAGAVREFKRLVRAAHAAGLEVFLDVVFNHTGEGGPGAPARSWKGLDRAAYFLLDRHGRDLDVTGCGHTFACASPPAADLIVGTLRRWAVEYHVDGFRFDLASVLARGPDGAPLADPPLTARIAADPALAHVKLIAEPWDAGGLYQVGSFPHHGRWAELNGRFRDDVRRFVKGAPVAPGALAARLAGSGDLYAPGRDAAHSVNFVTSHDGFTLADLVSYERKHNLANGEGGRDGSDTHDSWNCGAEGPSPAPRVRALRARQARNLAALLLLARGVPLWLWGDEALRSQAGNNNAWCHDDPEHWLDWTALERHAGFHRFVRGLLALRRGHAALRGPDAAAGERLGGPAWDGAAHRLALRLPGDGAGPGFVLLVNAAGAAARLELPAPGAGRAWRRVVDTAEPPPGDVTPLAAAPPLADGGAYRCRPHALALLGEA